MDLKQGEGTWKDWWYLVSPDKRVLDFVRRSVPTTYRVFADNRWYVHTKHVADVRQLMTSNGTLSAAEEDPWAVLHLRRDAPPAIINAVWRVLAKELHPDCGGDPQQFIRVKAAYEKITKV